MILIDELPMRDVPSPKAQPNRPVYNTPWNKPYRMGEVELQNDLAFYRDFL